MGGGGGGGGGGMGGGFAAAGRSQQQQLGSALSAAAKMYTATVLYIADIPVRILCLRREATRSVLHM